MWKSININQNQINGKTDRAILVSMPHSSEFDGYSFWHPIKLVKTGRHSSAMSISYSDDFTFNLKKYGKGKYNSREVIAEKTIGVDEFEEAFGVVDKNISKKEYKSPFETHTPIAIEAVETEAIDELKDD